MEHYEHHSSTEVALNIDVPGLKESTPHLLVTSTTKMREVIFIALEKLQNEADQLLWVGSGDASGKTKACADIVRRRRSELHEITRTTYKRVEELWKPITDGLDDLMVVREVPTVLILLSSVPLDPHEKGYSPPLCQQKRKGNIHRPIRKINSSLDMPHHWAQQSQKTRGSYGIHQKSKSSQNERGSTVEGDPGLKRMNHGGQDKGSHSDSEPTK